MEIKSLPLGLLDIKFPISARSLGNLIIIPTQMDEKVEAQENWECLLNKG